MWGELSSLQAWARLNFQCTQLYNFLILSYVYFTIEKTSNLHLRKKCLTLLKLHKLSSVWNSLFVV
jgi:hypothetical protein